MAKPRANKTKKKPETKSEKTRLAVTAITVDPELQMRAELSQDTIDEYAESLRQGVDLPPVCVFETGEKNYLLADGFHRYKAYCHEGCKEIDVEIRTGGRREALLYAVGANRTHGLRRSNADKKKATLALLNDDEWRKWSSRRIGEACGVSHTFVDSLRNEPSGNSCQTPEEVKCTRRGKEMAQRKTHRTAIDNDDPQVEALTSSIATPITAASVRRAANDLQNELSRFETIIKQPLISEDVRDGFFRELEAALRSHDAISQGEFLNT